MATIVHAAITPERDTPAASVPRGKMGVPAGWPIYAMFIGFPLWWVLGLGGLIWPLLAAPMLFSLLLRERIRIPRGFGIWLLFVGWMMVSAIRLDDLGRMIGFAYRASLYASATIVCVYVFNCSRQALPVRRVVWCLVGFWIFVIIGGFLGLLFPLVHFSTLMERLVPAELLSNELVYDLVHPGLAEIQRIGGQVITRPKAPFLYTNEWGANFGLLVPFVVLCWFSTRGAIRFALSFLLAVSLVPVILSLNRGLWGSVTVGLLYGALRLAGKGNVRAFVGITVLILSLATVVLLTPLDQVVSLRIDNPHSNRARFSLYDEAISGVKESPLVGFGGPRPAAGEYLPSVGTQGQLWMVLFSHGVPGTLLFLGFFSHFLWITRRAESGIRLWSHITIFMALLQMPVYGQVPVPLHIMMIAVALALRETPEKSNKERFAAHTAEAEVLRPGKEKDVVPSASVKTARLTKAGTVGCLRAVESR